LSEKIKKFEKSVGTKKTLFLCQYAQAGIKKESNADDALTAFQIELLQTHEDVPICGIG
jgi:hypothetical protein